jgi:hypothetical protein
MELHPFPEMENIGLAAGFFQDVANSGLGIKLEKRIVKLLEVVQGS